MTQWGKDANPTVTVIGGGLAGCEAAYQIAIRGLPVRLYEMRPGTMTPAHRTGALGELVCSNSLKSVEIHNAHGLLKEELRRLGSLLLGIADRHAVPAGKALAVNREDFSAEVTERIETLGGVEVVRHEVESIPEEGPVVVATGPLTSATLGTAIEHLVGDGSLHFYDAIAPIVDAESIDRSKVFAASRYGVEDDAYLNCPLDKSEYDSFAQELCRAEQFPLRDFEDPRYFAGCLPVEEVARGRISSLRFGAMKPVGLTDPRTGRRPYAVVQLRPENREGSAYNLVGFQTRLLKREQERVFRMIPGLERAVFFRYGSAHRNTYVKAPLVLLPTLQLRTDRRILFAGQITGAEGYVESIATGLLAGLNAARLARRKEALVLPDTVMLGALCSYLSSADGDSFQPMNANFGLLSPLAEAPGPRKERNMLLAKRALSDLEGWGEETLADRGGSDPTERR